MFYFSNLSVDATHLIGRLNRRFPTYIPRTRTPPASPVPMARPAPCLDDTPIDGIKVSKMARVAAATNAMTVTSSSLSDCLGIT
jgi:hypothetical protein